MPNRHECPNAAICTCRSRLERLHRFGARALALVAAVLMTPWSASAQNVVMPPAEPATMATDPGLPPMTQSGNVSFFSQDLGSILRLRFNTESYGQDGVGNFDVGTFQVVTMDDSAAFFDGQVTMNDVDGVGFNIGIGYRMLNFPPYSLDTGRVDGISLWADGTHTEAGNFFPQVGISYESLGELWDVRANGYIPVGKEEQVGDFEGTGEIGFQGNSLSQLTRAVVDTSFTVGEIEIARRLGSQRDAWAFAGPYFLTNDSNDAAGYRIGVRGYAYPDLLLQVAVSDDEIFHTNATFSLQWFVGRTRTNFVPACDVRDRFREPVMRNDYVAIEKSSRTNGIALTQPDGSALRFVHVDSNAAAGGDGTFENPFNEINQANGGGSQAGNIILAHAESVFNTSITLKDNQRFLGEGDEMTFTVATAEEGTIDIPETSPGARGLARPMIVEALGDAITLADNNEVANFDIDGGGVTARAIAAPAAGAGNPNLHDLAISDTTGDGIFFKPETIPDPNNAANQIVRGNVTIDDVTLTDIGGNGINIDSATATDVTLPTVSLQEAIAISDVTSTGGGGRGINIENTHSGTGHTATLTNYTYDGGTTSAGALRLNNIDGTFNASASTLTNGSSAAGTAGVQILGDTDGTLTFASTFNINNVDNEVAFDVNGDVAGVDQLGGSVTMNGTITNDTNGSVRVQNIATNGDVTFNGNITDSGTGILVNSNSGGDVTFISDLAMTIDTPAATAIRVTDNTGATIDFAGDVVINATSTASGFIATGGGTISAPGTTNSISVESGRALQVTGMTIDTPTIHFSDVNRTASAGTNAIQLENNTGAAITIGNTTDLVGEAGTIAGGSVDAIRIVDSANVSITGLRIDNTAAVSGVHVEKTNAAAMITNLSDLEINDGDIGIETIGGGTGAVTMTINDTAVNDSTATGLLFNNLDVGTVTVNATTVDGNNVNGTAGGVLITDSNATFNFDANTVVREFGGTDFEISGGAGTISYAGDIVNANAVNPADTTGRSVHVHNVTGGSITFTAASSINDDNQGMLVTNNTGGTSTFLGSNDFNTGASDAVTVTNNTGATISLSDLNIDTTTGRGLVATGGGTLTVLGTTNTIDTTSGVGLDIEGMTIGASGAAFQSVNVNGAANGIVLRNLTGAGDVTIGNTGGAQNSGGTLTTTGDAIIVENTANVTLQHIRIASAGGQGVNIDHTGAATTAMNVTINDLNLDASSGTGIDVLGANNANAFNVLLTNNDVEEQVTMSITGSGAFGLLVDNTDIDTSGTDVAFALSFSGSAQNGDVTIRNGNAFNSADASALSITTSGATFKTIDILVQDSAFTNNSLDEAVTFLSAGNTLMNATIQGNVFDDANAGGEDFAMESNGAQARIRLNLGGDVAADFNTAAGTGEYQLFENGGSDFDVFQKDDTFANARNNGTVVPNPNAAAFDDSAVAPPLPVVPSP